MVELKPCPFCGHSVVHERISAVLGSWVTIVECGACPAQMQSDTREAAIARWNARAYDPTVRRMSNHMKQAEWERNQAVRRLEAAQTIIDLNIGGAMKQEVSEAIVVLKEQGIEVAVDPSGALADTYTLTLPNGDQYDLLAAGILKLKADGKLSVAGVTEAGSRSGV